MTGVQTYALPIFKKQVKNSFVLKSPIDYNLSFDREKDSVSSNMYDQDFFNKVVHVRSGIDAHCSLNIMYLFVSEESLSIQLTGAYFSDNDFVNKTMIIPGSFDIGKWCRPVECAFIAKKEFNEISINRGDDYSYIKFDTDKDLNFKKFIFSDKMKKMLAENSQSRSYNKKKFKPLEYWYDLFHNSKQKRIIMKEIKDNLI